MPENRTPDLSGFQNPKGLGESRLPVVVIVGAGFGGLQAARKLAKAPLQVVLLDKRNYHLFQPLLYQIATAGISPGEIAHPVRGILGQQKNFQFHMAEVQQFDLENRRVITNTGSFDYDYLVIAVGAETNHFGIESVRRNALNMKDLDDAIDIRNKVLCSFELADQEPLCHPPAGIADFCGGRGWTDRGGNRRGALRADPAGVGQRLPGTGLR